MCCCANTFSLGVAAWVIGGPKQLSFFPPSIIWVAFLEASQRQEWSYPALLIHDAGVVRSVVLLSHGCFTV